VVDDHRMESLMESLTRYAPIVDDLDAFLAASARPLPRVVWANPLRADPERVRAAVFELCPAARAVPWWPHAWRLPAEVPLGSWLPFRLGHLHAQEEATLWPAALVGARAGDRVLDLCAAPGNKTALIAVGMGDRGTIMANEVRRGRLSQLRHTLERLGVTCAAVTRLDGRRLPREVAPFDHALVDAPCSCEGTSRKGSQGRIPDAFRRGIQSTQIGLLRRALEVVRPGGAVVYATCTYAPEENERVLDAISPELARIEPLIPPEGIRLAPGIREWEGRVFRPDVVHAARFWPHHHDTGGFFVARLRRLPAP